MFYYYNALQTKSGDILPDYLVRLLDASGNEVDIFADNSGTPIVSVSGVANAAKADDLGMVRFWVPNGTYDIAIYDTTDTFKGREEGVPLFDAGALTADLSAVTGATLVGSTGGITVQASLDARPTTAALASSTGGAMVGLDDGATTQQAISVAATPLSLLASTKPLVVGSTVRTADGFAYEVAAPGAVDGHVTTAGGVKLYVIPDADGAFNVRAFGAVGDNVADDQPPIQMALSVAGGRAVVLEKGKTYKIASDALVMDNNTDLLMNGATINFTVPGSKRNLAVGSGCRVIGGTINNTVGTSGLQGTYQTPIVIGYYGQLVSESNIELRDLTINTVTPGGNGIGIFGASSNITIDNIHFPTNANMAIGIMAHWSFQGGSPSPYSGITTHPHNLRISNISCGSLSYSGGNWRSLVFLSACYTCDVSNIYADNFLTGTGVIVYAGDWGFQFGTATEQALGFASTTIKNVTGRYQCGTHIYGLNPLEAVQQRWPGSIVIENVCAAGDGASANSIGIRLDACMNVKVRDCMVTGFSNGIALGGVVTQLTVERSLIQNSTLHGFKADTVTAGTGSISLRRNYFGGNNTTSTASQADVTLANVAGVVLEQNEWDSPLCQWNVRTANTVTRLLAVKNHTKQVSASGPSYSFGSSSDTNICLQFEGNTSDASPSGGIRGGQLVIADTFTSVVGTSEIQKRMSYGGAPASGAYTRGSIVLNDRPAQGGAFAYALPAAGSPGTWFPVGQVGPLTSIAATPSFVMQIAVVSGVGYMATGTSSTADWKQITA